jgi:hypothetical protein
VTKEEEACHLSSVVAIAKALMAQLDGVTADAAIQAAASIDGTRRIISELDELDAGLQEIVSKLGED